MTAYNFLRGLGVDLISHNFGQVDSIAGVIYSAADRRLSVTQSRFLIHGVSAGFQGIDTLPEKDLKSRLTASARDRETIAAILADRTGQPLETVKQDMLNERIMTAEEAQAYGFVHEVRDAIFDPSQEIIQIVG